MQYRGYEIRLNPDGCWDVFYRGEQVETVQSASQAQRHIDEWLSPV